MSRLLSEKKGNTELKRKVVTLPLTKEGKIKVPVSSHMGTLDTHRVVGLFGTECGGVHLLSSSSLGLTRERTRTSRGGGTLLTRSKDKDKEAPPNSVKVPSSQPRLSRHDPWETFLVNQGYRPSPTTTVQSSGPRKRD